MLSPHSRCAEWSGVGRKARIRSCLHHILGAVESDYVGEMLKHSLLGAIRYAFYPGSKYEELLCLVSGQGAGKSTFLLLGYTGRVVFR